MIFEYLPQPTEERLQVVIARVPAVMFLLLTLLGPSPIHAQERVQPSPADPSDADSVTVEGLGTVVPAGPGVTVFAGDGYQEGPWRLLSIEDGLPSGTVRDLLMGQDGVLWIATERGLSRYDGATFTTFAEADGLPENRVWSLFEDRDGVLWIGTLSGLSRYDGEHFTNFTVDDGLIENRMIALDMASDGVLWIGTPVGLSRFDGARFTNFPLEDGVISLEVTPEGVLWFGNLGGLHRYDGETFTNYTVDDGLAHNEVLAIHRDRDGALWMGTWDGGVSRYDGETFTNFTVDDGLADNRVWSLFEDREGTLWFGTQAGLSRFGGGRFTSFTLGERVGRGSVFALVEDGDGALWFGGVSGIGRFEDVGYREITVGDSLPALNMISSLEDRHGALWIGTVGGVVRYQDQQYSVFTTRDGLAGERVNAIHEDREGTLWFATNRGVSRYDGDRFTSFTTDDGLASNNIRAILEDREGALWFGTEVGLGRYDGEAFTTITSRDGLVDDYVSAVYQDRDGALWIGTNGGLSRYDGEGFTNFTTDDGLVGNWVTAIAEDRAGGVWIGTRTGVSRYDDEEGRIVATDVGTFGWVRTMIQDRSGVLWIGGAGGVIRYDGRVFQRLGRSDGLPANIVQEMHEGPRGEIWMVLEGSVVGYRPRPGVPRIVLDDVRTNRSQGAIDDVRLPTSQGSVIFVFQGASFRTQASRLLYRYRLTGYDAEWQTTSTPHVEYRDLPRGRYMFEAEAIDQDFGYSAPLQVSVTVHAPYALFALYSALGIALLIIGRLAALAVRRNRTIRAANKELMKAKDAAEAANRAKSAFLSSMSHELRTPLNAILGFAQLMHRNPDLPPAEHERLDIIGRSGEHLLTLINDVLEISKIEAGHTTLNEADFDLYALLDTLESMVGLRAEQKGLQLRFACEAEVPQYIRSDEGKLRQVLMNLLSNAVKFTTEGTITVRLYYDTDRLFVEVEDTGVGIAEEELDEVFDAFTQTESGRQTQEGTGLGLAISRKFVELLGGAITVESQLGQGSLFRFEIEAPEAEATALPVLQPERRVVALAAGEPAYRILVVDDHAVNRRLLVELLRTVGFEVRQAANGQQALETFEAWHPALIWMDQRMPGMSGGEATRRLKATQRGQETVVIALTASAFEEDRQQVLAAGCDDFVRRPFREAEIFEAMARHLGVAYVYAEVETAREEAPQRLTAADFEGVPGDWVAGLHRAAVLADDVEVQHHIEQIEAERPGLAKTLSQACYNFQFDVIVAAAAPYIEEAGES